MQVHPKFQQTVSFIQHFFAKARSVGVWKIPLWISRTFLLTSAPLFPWPQFQFGHLIILLSTLSKDWVTYAFYRGGSWKFTPPKDQTSFFNGNILLTLPTLFIIFQTSQRTTSKPYCKFLGNIISTLTSQQKFILVGERILNDEDIVDLKVTILAETIRRVIFCSMVLVLQLIEYITLSFFSLFCYWMRLLWIFPYLNSVEKVSRATICTLFIAQLRSTKRIRILRSTEGSGCGTTTSFLLWWKK